MRRTTSSPVGALNRGVLALALLALAPACASSVSTGDQVLLAAAETAVVIGDASEVLFWEFPRFLVWTAPKAVLYDLPRAGVLAVSGRRARVEDALARLSADDLTVEDELRICRELRSVTGIPLRSREGWARWWREAESVGEEQWLGTFVEKQIALLDSPDYFRRAAAIEHLSTLYGTDLGYDPKLAPSEAGGGGDRWRAHREAEATP